MYETSAVWEIEGADGTIVRFNDGASGLVLEEVTGWDSSSVRTNVEDLPEFDGAVAGDSFLGQRPWTLKGKVGVDQPATTRNRTVVNLQRAVRGLRSDVTVTTQPQGLPAMQATARFVALRVTGGFVKDFLISFISADPRAFSQTLNTETSSGGTVSVPGARWPIAWPANWGGGSGATLSVTVTNAGNFDSYPVVKVWGPVTDPQLTHAGTGLSVYLDGLTLASGEWVAVDMAAASAVKQDGVGVDDKVRWPGSEFWPLPAGSSTVQLFAASATVDTELDVSWRDSWA